MKKIYSAFVGMVCTLLCIAQTNPTPQSLSISFTSQTGSTLPAGFAVHKFSAIPTTRTTAPGTADLPYNSGSTSGGWKDETTNGLSLLASGSQQAGALIVSINTTGLTNIQVGWTARTILQQASRDNSVALQYRVGTSGNFIDVGTTSTYTSQGKTAGDFSSYTETLPAGAENQTEVQVRWIYWESNGTTGSRDRIAIDEISISGTGSGPDVTPPTVSGLSPADNATAVPVNTTATITFSETIQKGTGNIYVRRASDNFAVQTIDVTTGAVTLPATNQASFSLSLANSTAYYIEVDPNTFKDLSNNNFAGISGNTIWNFTTVAPPAAGVLGTTYNFNTCSNYINEGFKTYSVTGPQVWTCTKFGRTYTTDPSTDSAIEMNGFQSGNIENEDWLISPTFDLSGTNIPLLNFYSRNRFAGASLVLKVSTNYPGSGDPNLATWTTINGEFPAENSNVWTLSDSINLSAFKTTNVHIAWVYTSTTSAAVRWTLDDIRVYNSTQASQPTLVVNGNFLDFRYQGATTSSSAKTFTFYANDLTTDITLIAPTGYELSKNGTLFSSSITFTPAEAGNGLLTAYVRFTPPSANAVYTGYIQFNSTGVSRAAVFLKGNSQTTATTFNVANWNIEWFGSDSQNPPDAGQITNAKTVMDYLDADVYALSEIVDVTDFNTLVTSLNGSYSYVISEHCSGGTTAAACASSQKLALVYRNGVVSNVSARRMNLNGVNWANGRVPLFVSADVIKNGQATHVKFIVIHHKANTGNTDQDKIDAYFERKAGNQELKDTLDAFYANSNIVILGDLNDDMDRTIAPTTGADTVSSYVPIISDSTDADHYKVPTLPLSYFKLQSTVSNPDVIDHVIISNEMNSRYLAWSSTIYTDIASLTGISDYGNTTSDHYPVMTRFLFGSVLPVKLSGFTAVKQNNSVRISWTTSEEINAKEFQVERSTDGRTYQKIGTVSAQGAASSYSFIDAQPNKGNNFYRLRMVDLDNKTELSRVVKINFEKSYTVSLSPNPAKSVLNISITNSSAKFNFEIADMNGRVVRSGIISNQSNTVDISALSKGVYLVKLRTDNEVYTEKLIVE
jgi:hypothetical protein